MQISIKKNKRSKKESKMSLLLFSNPLPSFSPLSSSSCSSSIILTAAPVSRLHFKPIDLHPKSLNRFQFQIPILRSKWDVVLVNASSDIDGMDPTDNSEPSTESKEEIIPVDKLPLESKLQERMEQKMKMKLAKKIRLRRKRLLRKRRMRKKGRWPPSRMKKLKNV